MKVLKNIRNRSIRLKIDVRCGEAFGVDYDKLFENFSVADFLPILIRQSCEKFNGWKDRLAQCCDNLPANYESDYDLWVRVAYNPEYDKMIMAQLAPVDRNNKEF